MLLCLSLRAIDKLEAKPLVMGLVNHGNSDVRLQALLSIQKMMVQNWYALVVYPCVPCIVDQMCVP